MLPSALPNLLVTYAVCTATLLFTVKFANFAAVNSEERPAEDAMFKMPPPPADIRKRQRVVMNNLENVPYDALVFWAAFVSVLAQSIAGGGQQEALALNVLLPVYSASRVAFTVFYVRGMQPFRTISFVVGMCSVVSAAGVLLASAAKAYAL